MWCKCNLLLCLGYCQRSGIDKTKTFFNLHFALQTKTKAKRGMTFCAIFKLLYSDMSEVTNLDHRPLPPPFTSHSSLKEAVTEISCPRTIIAHPLYHQSQRQPIQWLNRWTAVGVYTYTHICCLYHLFIVLKGKSVLESPILQLFLLLLESCHEEWVISQNPSLPKFQSFW